MTENILTQERLKELFTYNPYTGLFTRNKISSKYANKKYSHGTVANYVDGEGYIAIRFGAAQLKAHRLVFLYMNGEMPVAVDHINRVRTDNRWSNLRSSNDNINSKNKSIYKNNTTGCHGVQEVEYGYRACIGGSKGRTYLGFYKNKEDAISARRAAEIKLGYTGEKIKHD